MTITSGTAQPSSSERGAERAEWDMVVVGGGTAGLLAARSAAGFGAKTVLIERERLGGDCLWTGCVPSKSLIAAASAAAVARGSERLGVTASGVTVDFSTVMAHVHGAMATIAPVDSAEALAKDGVEVITGNAVFTGEQSLEVDGRGIRFAQAMIATGGSPSVPDLPGAAGVDILTSSTFWDIDELPERLLVIGGGPIGCEIAQAMARLGSAVTVVHRGSRLLEKEDERVSSIIQKALEADGVTVLLGRSVASFTSGDRPRAGSALLDDGSELRFDAALAALGRRANTGGLGLDRAGVDLDDRGFVRVDAKLRTSNPRIRAAGDVTPLPPFTHTAGVNGSLGATNAVLGIARTVDDEAVPRVTFTHPEVGAVGVQPSDAAARGFRVVTTEHHDLDRAIAEGETNGFTSLVVDGRGRIRGATVVGPRAGETLGELGIAVRNRMTTTQFANTTHAYPTFDDAVWLAAVSDARRRLASGAIGKVTGVLRAIRDRRVG